MIYPKKMRTLTIILLLALPLIGLGIQNSMAEPTIWVISAEGYDGNVDLATRTLLHEISMVDCIVKTTTFERLDSVPFHSDVLVLVGHGQPDGLEVSDTIVPWSNLYDEIAERRPQRAVVLACHSPTDLESNIVGFSGQIDAEAGALLAAWHVKRLIGSNTEASVPTERIFAAQDAMMNPLESYVYFVHGFHGTNDQFLNLIEKLGILGTFDGYGDDNVRYFDYFEDYSSHSDAHAASIEEFAVNFKDKLINEHPAGTQIDIVAHSMGGLITRQMLMTERETLESSGIEIARVITLGTPHQGTNIAIPGLIPHFISILDLFYFPEPWICDVFYQWAPDHDFITTLNADPMNYSSGIEWYTFSAISNSPVAIVMSALHLDANDVPVASGRAHLSFATQTIIQDCEHNQLIDDTQQKTYANISTYLAGGIDSDNDGLLDVEERRVYSTDIYDSDSDNDGISDGDEVHIYGTNPNYWNTDGDVISDGNEVSWGYDPLDANSPIPASSLISSVSVIASSRTVKVYVNHYPAMDYVKFYVKYKTKFGSWTSYSYMGIDYSPFTNGDYYRTWTHPTVYTRMMVMVKAYDSDDNWLGSDYHTSGINPGGGGGGDPPPI